MIAHVFIALVLLIVMIVMFSRFFKRVTDSRRQKVVVVIASVLLFVGCLLLSLDSIAEWTPFQAFLVLGIGSSTWIGIFHVLVLATYASCGFSIGCGFLQVTQATMDSVKDSDMNMGMKRSTGRVLRVLEFYFTAVISVLVARVLLDFFGAIYAEPDVALVLNLMTVWPFLWLLLGLLIATIKFWRDRKFNTDFSLKHVQKFMAADKVYIHRVLLVFWLVMSTWIFLLMEFFTPGYPGLTIFSLCALAGYFVNREPVGFT